MTTYLHAVEFVGGPLDGHKEVVSLDVEELAGMLAVPVHAENGVLCGSAWRWRKTAATSVAVYHRTFDHGVCRYCFLGAATPTYASEQEV